jgi:hypothetical protein
VPRGRGSGGSLQQLTIDRVRPGVVDATGRGHRARQWLIAIGFPPPEETTIGLDTAYSTANFRRPESYSGEPLVFITGPAPHFTRRGYVITIENGTLLVSLIGRFGDYPPTDKHGFLAFANELHSDLAYRIIKDGEQPYADCAPTIR